MSLGHSQWRGRRKRTTRRMAHDLRQLAPMIAIACCFAGSATAILVVHRVPPTGLDELPSVAAARSVEASATDQGREAPRASAAPREDLAWRSTRERDAAGCPAASADSGLESGL